MTGSDGPVLAVSASWSAYDCSLQLADGSRLHDPGGDGLVPAVARLCERAGTAPDQLSELRLDLGPGSYTGLRVAVTFARTLAVFARVPVLVATSLELLALRAWESGAVEPGVTLRPILDARRQRYHHAALRLGKHIELVTPPAAVKADALFETIGSGETLLIEEVVRPVIEDVARHKQCAVLLLSPELRTQLSVCLLDRRLALRVAEVDQLEPLYLMGSYAE